MTDQDKLRELLPRPNRRQIISGMAAFGAATTISGRGALAQQKRIIISEGDFAPLPIAIPNFVAGKPAAGGVRAGRTRGTPKKPKRTRPFRPHHQPPSHPPRTHDPARP